MYVMQKNWLRTLAPLGFCVLTAGRSLPTPESPLVQEQGLPVVMVLTVAPGIVVGGNPATATITLSAADPRGATVIMLTSLAPGIAVFEGTDPATGALQLIIPAGSKTGIAPVRTFGQAAGAAVTLHASAGASTATAKLTVSAAAVTSLVFLPANVIGGAATTGTIRLDGAAPATGAQVNLSANSAVVSAPAVVSVPAGTSLASFTLTTTPTSADVQATVSATILGTPKSATVTVLAPNVSAVLLNPQSVTGGHPATGTVVLTAAAVGRAVPVSLTSSSSDASVPATLFIGTGRDRLDFTISTQNVASPRAVTITARLANSQPPPGSTPSITDGTSNTILVGETATGARANLTLTPIALVSTIPLLQSVVAQPSRVLGGTPVTITVTLQGVASDAVGLPFSVLLSTNQPQLLQLPAHVTIPAGSLTGTVSATTAAPSADQTVTITASSGTAISTTFLLQSPPPIATFTLRPTTLKGGLNIVAQLALSSTITRSVEVKLSTDHPELVTVPRSVILLGATPLAFTFTTSPTKVPTKVTIKVTIGTQTLSATVTLTL